MFLGQKQVTNSSNLHVLQNYKHTHVKHTTQLMNAPCKTFFIIIIIIIRLIEPFIIHVDPKLSN